MIFLPVHLQRQQLCWWSPITGYNCRQHPHELITYGGNGRFSKLGPIRLTMKYLSEMTNEQTLVIYSGHPLGLFPSPKDAPRWLLPMEWWSQLFLTGSLGKFNALGVSQYGQMTAGSYMYIGPQGIVHGTTITLLNAVRMISKSGEAKKSKLFLSSGLGVCLGSAKSRWYLQA